MPSKLPDHRALIEVGRRGAKLFQRRLELARKVCNRHTPVCAKDADGFCDSVDIGRGLSDQLTHIHFRGELHALPTCLQCLLAHGTPDSASDEPHELHSRLRMFRADRIK